MKFGLQFDRYEPEHYVLGAGLTTEILQSDGQWDDFLPDPVLQSQNGVEPSCCASVGTLLAIEIILGRKFNEKLKYSFRFLAKNSGTTSSGNSPHVVAESLRAEGTPFQNEWDYTPEIDTFDEFYASLPPSLRYLATTDFFDKYEFKHQWVYAPVAPLSVKEKVALIKESLTRSSVGISVSAWNLVNGIYQKFGQSNHWVCIYGYTDTAWKVYDSYENTHKLYDINADIEMAKSYSLNKKEVKKKKSWLTNLWVNFYQFIKDIFSKFL